jgi:hypothetical protein
VIISRLSPLVTQAPYNFFLSDLLPRTCTSNRLRIVKQQGKLLPLGTVAGASFFSIPTATATQNTNLDVNEFILIYFRTRTATTAAVSGHGIKRHHRIFLGIVLLECSPVISRMKRKMLQQLHIAILDYFIKAFPCRQRWHHCCLKQQTSIAFAHRPSLCSLLRDFSFDTLDD